MPPPGPPEPDRGTGPAGPLGPAARPAPVENPDAGWLPVPGKPWMEQHVATGRMRTRTYQPSTALPR